MRHIGAKLGWGFVGVCLFFSERNSYTNGRKTGDAAVNQVIGSEFDSHFSISRFCCASA
jgi:hypothetical protein